MWYMIEAPTTALIIIRGFFDSLFRGTCTDLTKIRLRKSVRVTRAAYRRVFFTCRIECFSHDTLSEAIWSSVTIPSTSTPRVAVLCYLNFVF